MTKYTGKLYGIGVGPGDPELLTVKAVRLIAAAKIIAYAAPCATESASESMARTIAAPYFPDNIVEYPIRLPMVVERAPAQKIYREAAAVLREYLSAGQDVLVLCQGDPLFYGSFMYLLPHLQADFAVEIVPGISSLMAASASLQTPLVCRNQSLAVVPAPLPDVQLRAVLAAHDTVAVLKIGRHLPRLRRLLSDMGYLPHGYYVERASQAGEFFCPLADLPYELTEAAPYFAMILVRKPGMDGN
ncbi:MAG: precorrin-2 C(20)-methyltransferase [Candidatus Symbiobacter sp.]|nr:precorrin-2 C(20)-methyltransferase [Candidatus Symbiobacter sp.]